MKTLFVLSQVCLAFFWSSHMTLYHLKISSNENFVCTSLLKRDELVKIEKTIGGK